jgi:hypothetical protein
LRDHFIADGGHKVDHGMIVGGIRVLCILGFIGHV